ncbi:MAG: PDZ domain-containing protein [Anaerolineales bacterium]|nr:PDZ domain-containing protein [Anaerolineales bacterium]
MSGLIQEVSEGLAAVVQSSDEMVLRVEGRRRLPGTGIVWSQDGVIVTAHHILERDEGIHVGLPNGEKVPAELVGRDSSTDLAALRIKGAELQQPRWEEPDTLNVGHLVLALGRPGQSVQSTLGIVSALGGSWRTPAGGHVDNYLQTDVVMYPGFSGGPLVSMSGGVLGLNTSVFRGTSIAIPTPTIKSVVESLIAHGRVRRGYLGVGIQPVRIPEAIAEDIDQETGLMVVSLEAGSPAETAGVTMGDTILALNGEPIRHMDELLTKLGPESAGMTSTLRILRSNEVKDLDVTIGEK